MAPVIVTLGAEHGLIIPLIAVHLFVFYFGILADDTPPVGLAAFAAAAIAKSDPIRTGIQGFTYDIRTAILPFMFIFNTQLLLMGIDSWWHLTLTVISSVIAMLIFSAANPRLVVYQEQVVGNRSTVSADVYFLPSRLLVGQDLPSHYPLPGYKRD